MICPRCGFPGNTPCRLCGQTDFVDYELTRFNQNGPARLEITVVVSKAALEKQLYNLSNIQYPLAETDEFSPRVFFFFHGNDLTQLNGFIQSISHTEDWFLLVNGRLRPFSQELWLPLLEMVMSKTQ